MYFFKVGPCDFIGGNSPTSRALLINSYRVPSRYCKN